MKGKQEKSNATGAAASHKHRPSESEVIQDMAEPRVLSPSELNVTYNKTRNKGQAEQDILDFVESGKSYIDLFDLPHNVGNKLDSVYNSYNSNVKKIEKTREEEAEKAGTESTFPEVKAVKHSWNGEEYDTVLLINVPVHLAELAAEMATSHAADEQAA